MVTCDGKLEQERDRGFGALSAVMKALLQSIVVKMELTRKNIFYLLVYFHSTDKGKNSINEKSLESSRYSSALKGVS